MQNATDTRAGGPSFEAVLRAGVAEVSVVTDSRVSADQLLRLNEVDAEVELFADRPTRSEGVLPLEQFLGLWHGGGFGDDPPNAALLIDGKVLAVELTGAVFDPVGRSVVFTVDGLEPDDGVPVELLPEGRHDDITLFIDALPAAVDPQITDRVPQVNVQVLGEAPASSMSALYQTTAEALGLSGEGQAATQQSLYTAPTFDSPVGSSGATPPGSATGLSAAETEILATG